MRSKDVHSDIQNYLERAQKYFKRIQSDMSRKDILFMDITECVYNLHQIKIAVAYRSTAGNVLDQQDKQAIEEIITLYEQADNILKDLQQESHPYPSFDEEEEKAPKISTNTPSLWGSIKKTKSSFSDDWE